MKMKRYLAIAMVMLPVLAVPSAARRRPKELVTPGASIARPAGDGPGEKVQPAMLEPEYLIGPQDVLDISVWKEPNNSRTVPVRPDGKISLPLINDVQAAGLTSMQLAASITATLQKYIPQPQVTVVVTEIKSRRVYVLGEINNRGPIEMIPNMTVLEALALAGGLDQFANQKRIYILRKENGKEFRYPFNYKRAIRGRALDQNILLRPGDLIVVP
jgi:polysaccharide export outer membrane protein